MWRVSLCTGGRLEFYMGLSLSTAKGQMWDCFPVAFIALPYSARLFVGIKELSSSSASVYLQSSRAVLISLASLLCCLLLTCFHLAPFPAELVSSQHFSVYNMPCSVFFVGVNLFLSRNTSSKRAKNVTILLILVTP